MAGGKAAGMPGWFKPANTPGQARDKVDYRAHYGVEQPDVGCASPAVPGANVPLHGEVRKFPQNRLDLAVS